uniref:Uncharacterized protein n=1 Tax=Physcomitrium patens TaxID=3218 RepID=A0A7I3ZUF0_PHYPA
MGGESRKNFLDKYQQHNPANYGFTTSAPHALFEIDDKWCCRVVCHLNTVAADAPAYTHALPACIYTGHHSADSKVMQCTLLMQLRLRDTTRLHEGLQQTTSTLSRN